MTGGSEPGPAPGMKLVSLRMSEDAWLAIQAEAKLAGVSASEFIREAAWFRLGYRWARRMDDDELAQRLQRIGAMPRPY